MTATTEKDAVIGSLLGTAVGDALGLCSEGMSKRRQRKMFKDMEGYHFILGRGMISDDTEHTCMVAQALIVSGGDTKRFTRSLAWRLRFWMLGLPAGIGFATLRAVVKLWAGFSGHRSGVFSAGNGPAMRSAIIGVSYGNDFKKMRELIRASTRITHTDPKAEYGSLAVALAAHMAVSTGVEEVAPGEYLGALESLLHGEQADEFLELMGKTIKSVAANKSTESFADELGLGKGVTGYIFHTVPVVIHCWLRNQDDFSSAILEVIRCGGDTDTTAAILGGIAGAGVGKNGIPQKWLSGLWEWPRSLGWMEELGDRLAGSAAQGEGQPALSLFVPGIVARNIFFMVVVLAHGFRRLFPPY